MRRNTHTDTSQLASPLFALTLKIFWKKQFHPRGTPQGFYMVELHEFIYMVTLLDATHINLINLRG